MRRLISGSNRPRSLRPTYILNCKASGHGLVRCRTKTGWTCSGRCWRTQTLAISDADRGGTTYHS
jgi:hypothetical protein